MADSVVRVATTQDTGNAVLDSVVNVMINTTCLIASGCPDYDEIKKLHALFAEFYASEPGKQGRVQPASRPTAKELQTRQ
jgi:hypothetical protein